MRRLTVSNTEMNSTKAFIKRRESTNLTLCENRLYITDGFRVVRAVQHIDLLCHMTDFATVSRVLIELDLFRTWKRAIALIA